MSNFKNHSFIEWMIEQDIGIQARTSKEGWAKMLEMKTGTSLEELCEGCPHAFMHYIKYAQSLCYEEELDYAYLCKLISSAYGTKDGYSSSNSICS